MKVALTLELLEEGTVERECAEKGERIYTPAGLVELLEELAAAKNTRVLTD